MQHSQDRAGEVFTVDHAFADPAFALLKERGAAFVVVHAGTREVLWANAAAAAYWDVGDAEALGRALFGAGGQGWLDGIADGVAPGRAPRLARGGLARGFRMRAHTAMIHAWTGPDGAIIVGFAVPETAQAGEAPGDAWRRRAWDTQRSAAPEDGEAARPAHDAAAAGGSAAEATEEFEDAEDAPGASLARRGQLAILRDRLNSAVDGAASIRLLWRTDAAGAVTQIDADTLGRLGTPLRFGSGALPDIVAGFDSAGAERLRLALASRATWSGVALALPVAGETATAPMTLSASPVFGPDRAFAGFRGFGIVDLARLALARPGARPAAIAPAPASPERPVDAAPVEAVERREAMADDPHSAQDNDPAIVLAAPAVDLPPTPPRPGNVVQLRAFPALATGRFGAAPVQPSIPAETASAETASAETAPADATAADAAEADAAEASDRVAGAPAEGEPSPIGDHTAFLALGEALRAHIDPPSHDPEPDPNAEARAPSPEPRPAEEAPAEVRPAPATGRSSLLLDQLPMALLVTVGGAPAFANAATAARLDYPSREAVMKAGAALMAPEATAAGSLALRDGHGATQILAGWSITFDWDGAVATLWILGDPEGAAAEPPSGPPPSVSGGGGEEARDGELLDRVDDAVALLDADGRIRRLNRRGEDWFGGAGTESAVGRPLTEVLAPESHAAGLALLGEVRAQRDGGRAPPLNRDVLARTGGPVPVPMRLTLGRLGAAGFYATWRDVTALRHAESERTRTERDRAGDAGRLSGLLAKVNHEIRTPLSAILGFAEVMMDERFGPLGNPRYRDYLKDMHASGTQVVAMVSDLLDLSRIEAGEIALDVGAVDINRIVAETVSQMQPEAHRERVIMRTSLAGRLPSVLADERSTRQIVRSLLSNAVKFNEPGGQVIVSTAQSEAGTVLLRVRDTGVGMTDEEIAAALEPFGGTALPRPVDGHGLGLPLTRALVGANGASMAIRSRPREGTLVEIAFTSAGAEATRLPA